MGFSTVDVRRAQAVYPAQPLSKPDGLHRRSTRNYAALVKRAGSRAAGSRALRLDQRQRLLTPHRSVLPPGQQWPSSSPWQLSVLVGWDVAAAFMVGSVWSFVFALDAASTQEVATREDDSRAVVDLIVVVACLISLVGVVVGLADARSHAGGIISSVLTGVAVFTVFLSWFTVHTLFVLRYAHLYYTAPMGGITFADSDEPPDYLDFVYCRLHGRHDLPGVRHGHPQAGHSPCGDSSRVAVVRVRHRHRRRGHQRCRQPDQVGLARASPRV